MLFRSDQLSLREQILSTRGYGSDDSFQVFHQKTPWIRMSSACDVYDKKTNNYTSDLAKRYILMGGSLGRESKGFIARRGFGRESSKNPKDENFIILNYFLIALYKITKIFILKRFVILCSLLFDWILLIFLKY